MIHAWHRWMQLRDITLTDSLTGQHTFSIVDRRACDFTEKRPAAGSLPVMIIALAAV